MSGRPIITTNRLGCRKIVDGGVNGFIVAEKSSKNLIDKIEQFLHLNLEQREKNESCDTQESVEREFGRQVIVTKYLAEIQNVR